MVLIRSIVLLVLTASPASLAWAGDVCGMSPNDWCTSPKDGACGRHMNEADCRADTKCAAVRYRGESVVACIWDERGFAGNCPAVGCQDR